MPEADRSLWSRGYLASHLLVTRGAGYGLNGVTCLRELSIVAIVNLSKEAALGIGNFWLASRAPPARRAGDAGLEQCVSSPGVTFSSRGWSAALAPAHSPRSGSAGRGSPAGGQRPAAA